MIFIEISLDSCPVPVHFVRRLCRAPLTSGLFCATQGPPKYKIDALMRFFDPLPNQVHVSHLST